MHKRINLDKYKSSTVGLVQSVGVVVYIVMFALFAMLVQNIMPNPPQIFAITLSLITFVFSALVCGATILGYPVILVIQGKVKRAIEVVVWSAAYLFLIACMILLMTTSFA